MPGHIKKSSGADPDPSPWLAVSDELKLKNKVKPYEPKKSVWVPNKVEGGYLEGLIESKDGAKVSVNVDGEIKVFKEDQVCQMNPPKFDCSEDMANLTFLGDACVLWNSVVRYKNELIYTYSGLFCIAINPYKRFPIYTLRTMELYVGRRRSEVWPHIFAIAEGAYQGMMNSGMNQSILITGESGAGKTENTKKVISYFATICSSGKRKEGEASLEDKIVATNPVLEAWGNAKTVRNDNSSRFGKFIRIHFNSAGKLSGADMVLESVPLHYIYVLYCDVGGLPAGEVPANLPAATGALLPLLLQPHVRRCARPQGNIVNNALQPYYFISF